MAWSLSTAGKSRLVQSQAEIPGGLQSALDAEPRVKEFFATLKRANRYAVLYRTHDAKTAKTRAARIAKLVAMLAADETVHGTRA